MRRRQRVGLDRLAGIQSPEQMREADARSPLPDDLLWRWTRIEAVRTGRTVSAIVEEALELLRTIEDGKDEGRP
jgi:hypothetical protein